MHRVSEVPDVDRRHLPAGWTAVRQSPAAGRESRLKGGEILRGPPLPSARVPDGDNALRSHDGFKAKLGLPFELISDPDEAVCLQFGVMKMKNMYGKQVRGVERSTFVIDADGRLVKEWRGVKVPEHAEAVLEFIQSLP